MATIPTGLAINTAVSSDRTTASGMRKALAALFTQSIPGVAVPGILAVAGSAPLDIQTSGSLMTYTVLKGFAVTVRTNQGVYLVGSIADTVLTVAAGDVSNARIDRIYIVQPDPELAESGVARIDVVQGTPSGTPALPALPTGALELGRKLVPSGASNSNAGTAVSNKAAYTSLNIPWDYITGKPSTFTPSAHTHTASQISDSTTVGRALLTAADAAAGRAAISVPRIDILSVLPSPGITGRLIAKIP